MPKKCTLWNDTLVRIKEILRFEWKQRTKRFVDFGVVNAVEEYVHHVKTRYDVIR